MDFRIRTKKGSKIVVCFIASAAALVAGCGLLDTDSKTTLTSSASYATSLCTDAEGSPCNLTNGYTCVGVMSAAAGGTYSNSYKLGELAEESGAQASCVNVKESGEYAEATGEYFRLCTPPNTTDLRDACSGISFMLKTGKWGPCMHSLSALTSSHPSGLDNANQEGADEWAKKYHEKAKASCVMESGAVETTDDTADNGDDTVVAASQTEPAETPDTTVGESVKGTPGNYTQLCIETPCDTYEGNTSKIVEGGVSSECYYDGINKKRLIPVRNGDDYILGANYKKVTCTRLTSKGEECSVSHTVDTDEEFVYDIENPKDTVSIGGYQVEASKQVLYAKTACPGEANDYLNQGIRIYTALCTYDYTQAEFSYQPWQYVPATNQTTNLYVRTCAGVSSGSFAAQAATDCPNTEAIFAKYDPDYIVGQTEGTAALCAYEADLSNIFKLDGWTEYKGVSIGIHSSSTSDSNMYFSEKQNIASEDAIFVSNLYNTASEDRILRKETLPCVAIHNSNINIKLKYEDNGTEYTIAECQNKSVSDLVGENVSTGKRLTLNCTNKAGDKGNGEDIPITLVRLSVR